MKRDMSFLGLEKWQLIREKMFKNMFQFQMIL
jgi:hypothetical protein